MIKKVFSLIMAIVIVFSVNLTSLNQKKGIKSQDITNNPKTQLISSIDDPKKTQEIIEKEVFSVSESYNFEKVETFVYSNDDFDNNLSLKGKSLLYEIRNVRHSLNKFIYIDQFKSDWFDGPCTMSANYIKEDSVSIGYNTKIGNQTVSRAVGYSITKKHINTKALDVEVEADKKINVKVFTSYKVTQFDIYNKWTNKLVEKDAWIAKPIDITISQFTFNN